jgi:SAM-dependent methyltransferase
MHQMMTAEAAPTEKTACWVCGSSRSVAYKPRSIDRALTPEDLRISDSNYGCTLALRRCSQCGFISADRSELSALFHLYESLEDSGYEESQDSRALQMGWLLDLAAKSHPNIRSSLDVGAASGLLVGMARQRGWQAEGVEPSVRLVNAAAKLHGVQLLQGQLPHASLAGRTFDAVFLVDVIEHVSDPLQLLQHATSHVAPGGILMVVTPDVRSLACRLLGPRWWHFRLAHVGYFDESSFAEACRRSGLAVRQRIRAKWFFRMKYLAERITRYLPVSGLTRLLEGTRPGARAANWLVPLNLHDSWVFICERAAGRGMSPPPN